MPSKGAELALVLTREKRCRSFQSRRGQDLNRDLPALEGRCLMHETNPQIIAHWLHAVVSRDDCNGTYLVDGR